MAAPSHLKTLHPLHAFSMKPVMPSSSTLTSMKLKNLVHTFILSHLCRVTRALNKAKSILIEVLKEIQLVLHIEPMKKNKNKKKYKLFFGSFRMHYNWCSSSHVVPVYYDSTWNSVITSECDDVGDSQLSGYLNWLEEEKVNRGCSTANDMNEIDRLADMFIANCHEKFRLEKQESYRAFQEMMARSV